MEAGFYQRGVETRLGAHQSANHVSSDWRRSLPVVFAGGVTLREVQISDAPSLLAMLSTEEVARFISPPPTTIEGFERFIRWAHEQRAAGRCICFAVVPAGTATAVGIFQVRALAPDFSVAEWGFALGSPYWGTGIFEQSARHVVTFAFGRVGVRRLEARATVENGRGNSALRKIGAVRESVLRKSFLRNGRYHDQALWAIVDIDRFARTSFLPTLH